MSRSLSFTRARERRTLALIRAGIPLPRGWRDVRVGFDLSDIGDAFVDAVNAVVDTVAYLGKHLDSVAEIMIIAGLVICTGGAIAIAAGVGGKACLIVMAVGAAFSSAGASLKAVTDKYGADITAAVQWAQTGAHSATEALRKVIDKLPPAEMADLIASQDYRIAYNLLTDYGRYPERAAGLIPPTFRDPDVDIAAILRNVDANILTAREASEAFANSGYMAESYIERAHWEEGLRNSPLGALIRAGIAEDSGSAAVMLGVARDFDRVVTDSRPANSAELTGLAATLRERAKVAASNAAQAFAAAETSKKALIASGQWQRRYPPVPLFFAAATPISHAFHRS